MDKGHEQVIYKKKKDLKLKKIGQEEKSFLKCSKNLQNKL